MVWKNLFQPVLRSTDSISHVDGSDPCPPSHILNQNNKQIQNPACRINMEPDWWYYHLLEILLQVMSPATSQTAHQLWTAIESLSIWISFSNTTKGIKTILVSSNFENYFRFPSFSWPYDLGWGPCNSSPCWSSSWIWKFCHHYHLTSSITKILDYSLPVVYSRITPTTLSFFISIRDIFCYVCQ